MNKVSIFGHSKKIGLAKKEIKVLIDNTLKIFDITNSLTEISFVSKLEIQEINKQYRNIDKPTDVLSFPQIEIPGQKLRLMGSIVISLDIVNEKEENPENVIKHGLLHLLNYDHETNEIEWESAAKMINCKM